MPSMRCNFVDTIDLALLQLLKLLISFDFIKKYLQPFLILQYFTSGCFESEIIVELHCCLTRNSLLLEAHFLGLHRTRLWIDAILYL